MVPSAPDWVGARWGCGRRARWGLAFYFAAIGNHLEVDALANSVISAAVTIGRSKRGPDETH